MHFIVHAVDKPDALLRRQAVIDAHRSYTREAPARHGIEVLISGPLFKDDGVTMGGSFFLLDAPNRSAVDALIADDPIANAEVWDSVSIKPFLLRVNAFEKSEQA